MANHQRNISHDMLSMIDLISLSQRFTLEEIATQFDCSISHVQRVKERQRNDKIINPIDEYDVCVEKGAWINSSERKSYKQIKTLIDKTIAHIK